MGGTWSVSLPRIVECPGKDCRARYERTTMSLPLRDADSKNCEACGIEMESWSTTRMPMYKRIDDAPAQSDAAE